MAVVGIDLGTTNTVVAAVRDGRAAAIKDKLGRALLPSVVSFPPRGEPKVGYEAKDRRTLDPENTVFSIKRLIGRSWDSQHVEKARTRFPFRLKEGPGKATLVSCQGKDYTLPEISAMVLSSAREVAEQRLGQLVNAAVVTVPANFNDLQRAATKVAGRVAGLEVLRIVNEPTAAALAYGFGKRGRERLAVYDFGGGTFDVTLLDLSENVFEVLSTAGDTFLGGDDLDHEIVLRMGEELRKKHRIDMEQDNLVVEQLRAASEKLKMDLSTRSMGRAVIPEIGFVGGKPVDFEFTLRRADFEKLAEPYLERTLEVCQEALDIAGISPKELDQVLLVGGSTRIPLVRRRISSFFGRMPQSRINPDEVVAIGAAIQASALESKATAGKIPAAPTPSSLQPRNRGGTKMGLAAPSGGTLGAPDSRSAASRSVAPGSSPEPSFGRHRFKTLAGVGSQPSQPDKQGGEEQRGPGTLSGIGEPPEPEEIQRLQRSAARPADPDSDSGEEEQTARIRPSTLEYPQSTRPKFDAPRPDPAHEDPTIRLKPGSPASLDSDDELPTGEFEQSAFDDITSVLKRPDQIARLQDKKAELGETLLGSGGPPAKPGADLHAKPTPPGTPAQQGAPPAPTTEEGSVTFDLAELEEEAAAAEAKQAAAPEIGKTAEREGEEADLPTLVRHRLEDIEEVSGVLEMPEDDEDDLEVDLPDVSRRQQADLPDVLVRRTDDLPATTEADLPVVSAGLPETARELPGRPSPDLPSPVQQPELPTLAQQRGLQATQTGPRPGGPLSDDDASEETGILGSFPNPDPRAPLESVSDPRGGFPHRPRLASIDESIDEVLSSPSGPAISGTSNHPSVSDSRRGLQSGVAMTSSQAPPLLIDVTPLALGVETVGGFVETMIDRNRPVPCARTHTFATARDQQQLVRVRVSQGQGNRFIENTLLGEVELRGLKPGPRGSVKIDVTFSLDESGILAVSARDQETGQAADARLKLVGLGDLSAP